LPGSVVEERKGFLRYVLLFDIPDFVLFIGRVEVFVLFEIYFYDFRDNFLLMVGVFLVLVLD
jgi:hypothetical protein